MLLENVPKPSGEDGASLHSNPFSDKKSSTKRFLFIKKKTFLRVFLTLWEKRRLKVDVFHSR